MTFSEWLAGLALRRVARRLGYNAPEGGPMNQTIFKGIQWANFLTLIAQITNMATGLFPALQMSPWVLAVQGIIGAFLPGVGHTIAPGTFGTVQPPPQAK